MEVDAHAAIALTLALGGDVVCAQMPVVRLRTREPERPTETPTEKPELKPERTIKATPIQPAETPVAQEAAQAAVDACTTPQALIEMVRHFNFGEHARGARQIVLPDGHPQAHTLVIGEAPGLEEDATGRPFIGPAGRLLDAMAAAVDLSRTAPDPASGLLLLDSVFTYPPGGRRPTADAVAICQPFVRRLIVLHQPRVVVACGGIAAAALLESELGITALRGKPVPLPFAPHILCLPMLHPAYLLRVPGAKKPAWHDWLLLRERLLGG